MKKTWAVMLVGLVLLAAPAARAAEASMDLVVNSHYVWRGQVLNDEAVFQPSLTVESPCGLSFNTWANFDLTDRNDMSSEFTEVDLTVSYGRELGELIELELGVVQYVLENADNTVEAFATLSADVLLSPTLSLYYDFDQVKDVYLLAAVGHEIELAEALTLSLGASLGFGGKDYNEYYFGSDSAAVNDANVSAGLTYALTEQVSLGASIQYTALLDSDIKDGAEATYGEKDVVFGGATLSMSF